MVKNVSEEIEDLYEAIRANQRRLGDFVTYAKPETICEHLKRKVYGQDEALRRASILIYAYLSNASKGYFDTRLNFLVIGKSGCGKSTFANCLQSCVGVPVFTIDGSALCPSGYKGTSLGDALVAEMLSEDLQRWGGVGICIIDEIDKAMQKKGSSIDDYNRYIQESMLKALDGGTTYNKDGVPVDCSRLLFIGMGAFTQVREMANEKPAPRIGFGEDNTPKAQEEEREVTVDDLTKYCGSEQFVGRFLDVIQFKQLGEEVYGKIVDDAIKEVREVYGFWEICKGKKREIVANARNSDYGARFIRSEVWKRFIDGYSELPPSITRMTDDFDIDSLKSPKLDNITA